MRYNKIKTSLIISTYNWPGALKLCLLSVKALEVLPDEVIITDDGSAEDTRLMINTFQKDFPVPLIHIWQPDEGFQLGKVRNKGIAASSCDYIIQIDGDLILHPMFVADHIAYCKTGSFVSGSRVLLNKAYADKLIILDKYTISLFNKGVTNKLNGLHISFLRDFLSGIYRVNNIYKLRGCNMAFWRKDLINVNGYNEAITGWGLEDNEIAVRLVNSGIQKRTLKFGAIVYHIFHPENKKSGMENNAVLLGETIVFKVVFCDKGLNQYL